MKERQQSPADRHLDVPSEANRDNHINFPKIEEESAGNYAIDKSTTDRQKQWKQGIEEGKEEWNDSGSKENT